MRLKITAPLIAILPLVFFLSFIFVLPVFSQNELERHQELQKEIEELETKVAQLAEQSRTLSSTILFLDNQVSLTTARIEKTEVEIAVLETEIASLSAKIDRLDVSLDQVSSILLSRITETYKQGRIHPLTLLFSSRGFGDFIARFKYLRVIQRHDRNLLIQMEATRTNYDAQKELKEEKQAETEVLKARLESQKQTLAQQKQDKEMLLEVTKSDEKRFRDMLARAREEMAAIERILAGFGDVAEIGPVSSGETVGTYIAGASACSSGGHLHFEVVKDGSHQNPAGYLKNISLIFEDNVSQFTPNGSWDWPIFEPIRITQEYGDTFWARLGWYGGGPHTGVDMVSGTSISDQGSRTVKAAKEGSLYRGSIACGGGTLRFARVDQSDGMQTYYMHLD